MLNYPSLPILSHPLSIHTVLHLTTTSSCPFQSTQQYILGVKKACEMSILSTASHKNLPLAFRPLVPCMLWVKQIPPSPPPPPPPQPPSITLLMFDLNNISCYKWQSPTPCPSLSIRPTVHVVSMASHTRNCPHWKWDPEQQQCYIVGFKWDQEPLHWQQCYIVGFKWDPETQHWQQCYIMGFKRHRAPALAAVLYHGVSLFCFLKLTFWWGR